MAGNSNQISDKSVASGGSTVDRESKTYAAIAAKIMNAYATSTRAINETITPYFTTDSSAYHAVSEDPADRQIRRLYTMRHVDSGWAGPGSVAPDQDSINRAVELIGRFRGLPFPVPMASVGSDGNAGLSWSDSKVYADIEILENGKIGYLVEVKGGSTIDEEVDFPPVGLPRGIAWALTSAYLSKKK